VSPKNDKARKAWLAALTEGQVGLYRDGRVQAKIAIHRGGSWFLGPKGHSFTLATGLNSSGKRREWIVPLDDPALAELGRAEQVLAARCVMQKVRWLMFDDRSLGSDEQALACAAVIRPDLFGPGVGGK